jgi:DNA-binding winged helix-turn-helix (wHTH) protein
MHDMDGALLWPSPGHSCWSSVIARWSTAPKEQPRCFVSSAPKSERSTCGTTSSRSWSRPKAAGTCGRWSSRPESGRIWRLPRCGPREWTRSEFATEERLKIGSLVVDRAAHEVSVDGRRVTLTAKEFALLAFLAANRGRVFSRETLLARVWGSRYEGGARTVDIHVRRLRAKLGDALPLETLRGAGYKLRAPSDAGKGR